MSDTPETDAFGAGTSADADSAFMDMSAHARKMERERDAARAALRAILESGVEHDDPRLDYITVQVARKDWNNGRTAAGLENEWGEK